MSVLQSIFPRERCQGDECQQRKWSIQFVGDSGIAINGRWHCGPRCFELAAIGELRRILAIAAPPVRQMNRIPLGLLMASRGFICHDDLRKAIDVQKYEGEGKIGFWLQKVAKATEQQIASCVAMQSGCAVFPVPREPAGGPGLPLAITERFQAVPVFYSAQKQTLYLGFSGPVDRSLTLCVEQIGHTKVEPCVITDSEMRAGLAHFHSSTERRESILEQNCTPAEMAKIVRSYALQLNCHGVDIVSCRGIVWTRLTTHAGPYDIVFGKPVESRFEDSVEIGSGLN